MLYEQPRLYDALYDRFTEDIEFYTDIAREGSGPVCELACGTGRVTVPLAETGLQVTGIDSSPQMIDAARTRAAASDAGDRVTLDVGDMRAPLPNGAFTTVLVPLHSLSHLLTVEEIRAALTAIHGGLRTGGRLALALHNPDPAYLAGDDDGIRRIHREVSSLAIYETTRYHSDRQVLDIKWYVETSDETSLVTYPLRMIFPEELRLLLDVSGFEMEDRFGWYDRRPFSAESGTQVVVARRR